MGNTTMRVGLPTGLSALLLLPTLLAQTPQPPVSQAANAIPPQTSTPAITRESLAGAYDGGQMEVAARLLLKTDGHFEYDLAYGALDEAAEGIWELKPGAVLLTTVPAVTPPRFVVESDTPDAKLGLWVKISNGPVEQGARQRIYLLYGPNDPPDMAEVADDGSVPFTNHRRPSAISPEIPVYPVMSPPIPLTGIGGHRLVLRFEPKDIGKANFHQQPLVIRGGALVMPRRDLQLMLEFKRQPASP